jgi:hypothetical protein
MGMTSQRRYFLEEVEIHDFVCSTRRHCSRILQTMNSRHQDETFLDVCKVNYMVKQNPKIKVMAKQVLV